MSQTFEKNLLIPCLLDIYGGLLSERKRELLDYYYDEDYSLSEISELTGISRQGIRDSIKKSSAELIDLEDKLRLYEKKNSITRLLEESRETVEKLSDGADASLIASLLTRLETIEDLL
ncbi:MAG: DNA-binding protein [Clostridia bacterium]|nr:DNA-binding protein [Clostridia bacterium]MBR5446931.1 DNA-binding protein [Clostridia bacterium]MBR5633016.1 DNA-binding protein [Clostridia bacterium]